MTSNGKEWGCIDLDGKYVINPQFEGQFANPYEFKNGLSIISQAGTFGFIGSDGKYVINPQFKEVRRFASNDLAAVQNSDGKWGFVDRDGKYQINPQFDDVRSGFIGEVAFVKGSDKFGIIDEKGRYIVNPQFDNVGIFEYRGAFIVQSDYVDYAGIAEELFRNSGPTEHLGLSSNTTLGELIDNYPDVDVDQLDAYALDIDTPKISVSELIGLGFMRVGFDDKTYSEVPIYKTVTKYSYYYQQYYEDKEFDRMEKRILLSSPVTYVTLSFSLKRTGKGKAKSLADALKREAMRKMDLSEVTGLEIPISDNKGVYIMESKDLLVYVHYQQQDGEDTYPGFVIGMVNSTYDTPFEDVKSNWVKDFKKE